MFGALAGGAVAQLGVGIELHFIVVMPLLALAGFLVSSQLPRLGNLAPPLEESGAIIRLPSKSIVLLCVLPIGIMLVEGAFIDWSAVCGCVAIKFGSAFLSKQSCRHLVWQQQQVLRCFHSLQTQLLLLQVLL